MFNISSSGNVGIGTTSPSAKIHADNTATTGVGAIIENSNVTNTDDIIQFHNSTGEVASVTNEGYLNIKAATGTSDTVLIIDNDVVQKKVLPALESGTYTPTLTDSLNITSSAVVNAHYLRVGNIVTVYVKLDISSAAASQTILGISLPIASNLTSINDVIGSMVYLNKTIGSSQGDGFFYGDIGADKAYAVFSPTTTNSRFLIGSFTYEIK
jgi:hypothetical protein